VGRIYQQTFIDTYAKVAFAKLYDRKTPITAANLLNDRVVPFYDEYGIASCRVLTDRGTEYCGRSEHHEYELCLAVEDIDMPLPPHARYNRSTRHCGTSITKRMVNPPRCQACRHTPHAWGPPRLRAARRSARIRRPMGPLRKRMARRSREKDPAWAAVLARSPAPIRTRRGPSGPWEPRGHDQFKGEIIHVSALKSRDQLAAKRLVVVGYGKSATDLAVESAAVATETHVILCHAHRPVPRNLLEILPFKWGMLNRLTNTLIPMYLHPSSLERWVHTLGRPLIWFWWRLVALLLRFQCRLESRFGTRVLLLRHDHLMSESRQRSLGRAMLWRAALVQICPWRPVWMPGTSGNGRWAFAWILWLANRSEPTLLRWSERVRAS
jgi:hypothetical protein